MQSLCYDELATIISKRNVRHQKMQIDPYFLSWLCELATKDFQQLFIVEELPTIQNGIPIEFQKCINSVEDSDSSEIKNIAINIAGIVLQTTDR